MHALIIGDHHLLADLLKRDLTNIGYSSVAVAANEDEALTLAAKQCPDLIMVDDRYSLGHGIEAIHEICREKPIPVVFVTGNPLRIHASIPDAVTVDNFGAPNLRAAIQQAAAGTLDVPLVLEKHQL